jgi:rRNA small subunit pseudouridine methyltransferase Nep1
MAQPQDKARLPKSFKERESARRLIVVLDGAQLETVKNGSEYELLNCDDHATLLKKRKRDAAECRPDITHQVRIV